MNDIQTACCILLILCIFEAIALTLIRVGDTRKVVVASFIYGLIVVPLLYVSFKYQGLGMINFMWNVFSTLLAFLVGFYMFNEKVDNLQILGAMISLLGLGLIILA